MQNEASGQYFEDGDFSESVSAALFKCNGLTPALLLTWPVPPELSPGG